MVHYCTLRYMRANEHGTLGGLMYTRVNECGTPSRLIYIRVNEHDAPVHIDMHAG